MNRLKLLAVAACVACGGVLVAGFWRPPAPPEPLEAKVPAANPVPPEAETPTFAPPAAEAEAFPPLVRFGDARLRHAAPVKSLVLTADGKYLLTATREEPVIRLWDVKTGKLLRAVRVEEEFTQSMTVLALTPDARKAFVMRHQPRQRVSESHRWHEPATVDLVTGAVMRWPLGDESENLHPVVALSPDGKTLAGGVSSVWTFANGAPRDPDWTKYGLNGHGNVCFSPDGKYIAACSAGAAFFVAPVDGSAPPRKITVKCGNNDVRAVHWCAPDRVVARWYCGLAAYDPATGIELARNDLDGNVNLHTPLFSGAPTSAGNLLFAKTDNYGGIKTFDLATLKEVPGRESPRNDRDEAFTVSANGRVLAVVSGHAVRLFDAATGKPLHPELETAPFAPLARLHVSPDGARLLGCTDHTAHAWALSDARTLAKLDGLGSWSMSRFALSPDGRHAGGGFADGVPHLTEVDTGREIALPKGDPEKGRNDVVGFAGNDRVWLHNHQADTFTPVEFATGRAGATVKGFAHSVFVAVAPDGRKIAVSGHSGLALLDLDDKRGWQILDEYKERRVLRCGLAPPDCGIPTRFSPCGRWLLVSDNGLEVWDVRKHPVRAGRFDTPGGREWTWWDGSFSADGRYLAAVVLAKDGASELCVWETASASEVYRFRPARGVAGCIFTPDGKRLIVAHRDTTLSVWDRATVEARQLGDVPAGEEWKALRSRDAKQAHAAARALVAKPERAFAVLAPQFAPPDAALANRLIKELESEDYREREAAEKSLAELGMRAEPALRVAVTKSESPEVRARAAVLLGSLGAGEGRMSGDRLRAARAVEVLERIASPEAKALLATWAKTYPAGPLAAEANAALGRLGK